MRKPIPTMAALGAAFLMSACGVLQQVTEPATHVIARGIDEACADGITPLAIEARKATVAAINAKTTVGNHTPSDCDGDGEPDFPIDASGAPVPAS